MIRSLTIGLPILNQSQDGLLGETKNLIDVARAELVQAGFPPRTTRYTLPPIGSVGETDGYIHSVLSWVDKLAEATQVRWYCLPLNFVPEGRRQGRLDAALNIIERFPRAFVNLMVADSKVLNVAAINDAAQLVKSISRKSNNGFDNFRVGASCGCPPNAPFFPFSHHGGDKLAFSFALENCGIANAVLNTMGSTLDIDEFRDQLVQKLTTNFETVNAVGLAIENKTGVAFAGLDASFAPFPGEQISVAEIVERLIGTQIGSSGSIFATSLLSDALRAALKTSEARSVGFNGVMYSLLEDQVLASANNKRKVSLEGLLALSTVCGCGIDMVPVSGSSFPEELASVMLDTASVSLALNKPLGVRLLPIPNRVTNELTQFNLDFLCDSRIVNLSEQDRFITSRKESIGLIEPRFSKR